MVIKNKGVLEYMPTVIHASTLLKKPVGFATIDAWKKIYPENFKGGGEVVWVPLKDLPEDHIAHKEEVYAEIV